MLSFENAPGALIGAYQVHRPRLRPERLCQTAGDMLHGLVRPVAVPSVASQGWSDDRALAQLLGRVAMQDRAAFTQFYHATAPKLVGVVMRIVADRQLAEDVVQDVFVTVWRKAAEYDATRARPTTWLVVIARNRAIDVVRSARTRRADPIDDVTERLVEPTTSAESGAVVRDEFLRAQAALADLDPRHAQLIRDTYLGGLSYEDAAQHAGVPIGTAKTWIHRGLMRLRQRLAP